MKVGVLLSGCGVYDGSEIHEAVLTLLALDQLGTKVQCIAPNKKQHHVVNHLNGEEMPESRNVLIESARIARGDIKALDSVNVADFDALVLPGGFGAAKNLCTWAFSGPESEIDAEVKSLIQTFHQAGKPIAALCVAPVLIAKSFAELNTPVKMTLGHKDQSSEYDIKGFHEGVASLGMTPEDCALGDIIVDETNKIITSPCYMMQGSISKIYQGVYKACEKLIELAG